MGNLVRKEFRMADIEKNITCLKGAWNLRNNFGLANFFLDI